MSVGTIQPSSLPSTPLEQTAPHKAWNLPVQYPGALPAAPTRSWGVLGACGPAEWPHIDRASAATMTAARAAAARCRSAPRPCRGQREPRARAGKGGSLWAWWRLALGRSLQPRIPCAVVSDAHPWSAMLALCSSLEWENGERGADPSIPRHPVTGPVEMAQNCRRRGSDWTLECISLPRGWSDSETGFHRKVVNAPRHQW